MRAAKISDLLAGASARAAICALLMTLTVSMFSTVDADEVGAKNRKANKLYSKGQYDEALKLYGDALLLDPSDGKLKMNKGSALYRLGELDEAEKSYQDALSSRLGKKALADAHYNLGNIQYKQAEKLESSGDAASARKKYSGALESYVNTLKLRPNDMDAKWNLQLAHRKIDVLKDTQDKNQDENKDKEQNQDDRDQQQQKERQGDDKDDKKNERDNKEQSDNKEQQDNEEQQDNKEQQGNEQQQPDKGDEKKEEAGRLIEQYADDSDSLNKPVFQRARTKQPDKDW
jgi:tetratricopeptide (TPR) repeat protein